MRIILLACAMLATSPLFSDGNPAVTDQATMTDDQPTFLLPLDVTKEPKSHFTVTIPRGFNSIQPIEQFGNAQEVMIEYIPQNESVNNWSEIITLNKYIGQRIQAGQVTDLLKKSLPNTTQNSKVLLSKTFKEKNIEYSRLIMQYVSEGKQEVMGATYVSGPYDSAGVQYTIRLKGNQSVSNAVKKIEWFFKSNSNVITN